MIYNQHDKSSIGGCLGVVSENGFLIEKIKQILNVDAKAFITEFHIASKIEDVYEVVYGEKTENNIPKIKSDDSPISRAIREVSPLHIRIDLNCSLPISTNIREWSLKL